MTETSFILLALKTSLLLSVLAIGLTASFADATYLLRRPRELLLAMLSMNVMMPIVAFAIVRMFDLNPAVKIALVALSVSPVPPIFPNAARKKASGSGDYTIGLLVATSLLAIVVVPTAMKMFERLTGLPLGMSARSIATMVLGATIAPLVVGIALRAVAGTGIERVAKVVGTVALICLVASFLPILFQAARPLAALVGDGTLGSMTLFALTGALIGHGLGGPTAANRRVLALATASRHPGMAIAIAHANFPEQRLAIVAILLYLIVSAIAFAIYSRVLGTARAS